MILSNLSMKNNTITATYHYEKSISLEDDDITQLITPNKHFA